MKTRYLILIGIVILSTVPFATIIVLDRYDNYLEQLEYERLAIENQPKPGERSYIEPVLKAKLEKVELELRDKVKQLHEGLPPSSYAVNLNLQTKEIEAFIENKQLIPKIKEFATKYPDDIIIIVEYGKFGFGELPFEKIDTIADKEDEELHVAWCAYIGFEKYPQNLFDEFLENPYNKDVTFLNFTDIDLKKVPLFYELILEANQTEYPLNDRVSFPVSYDEYFEIKDYLKQRTYFEIKRNGEVLTDQTGSGYRTPQILIDDKLYRINGLGGQVFSDRDEILNVSYEWTLEEAKKNIFEDDNPNRANLIYFELNEKDIENLKLVKDAIDKMYASDDKIRKSLDVGSTIQNKVQDFFKSENQKQFNGDESKYTHYFILNGTMHETSFVTC